MHLMHESSPETDYTHLCVSGAPHSKLAKPQAYAVELGDAFLDLS